jgi:hypothetical protein
MTKKRIEGMQDPKLEFNSWYYNPTLENELKRREIALELGDLSLEQDVEVLPVEDDDEHIA